jgi:predicted ATP-grasp superfamily ATP-dependent carboligase
MSFQTDLVAGSIRAGERTTTTPVSSGAGRATPPGLDVLILDAQYRQALTCMRVFSRAGLRVGTVACQSDAEGAPAFRSRWCRLRAVVPDVADDADAYVDTLLKVLETCPAQMVLPCHDGSIEAIRARRADLERHTAIPLGSEAALDIAVSKVRTLAVAQELGIAVPRSVLVTDTADVAAAIREVGCPAVVKPVQSWVERDGVGTRVTSEAVLTADEARASLNYMLSVGAHAVIQQWLPGRREAVSVMYARGTMWARFAQASHREFPALGGVSVLCESIPLLPDITDAAERLIRAIDLEGCSMVEFRRDAEGRPVLMEINPRIGGSVALAVSSGVNFPLLLRDWALGNPLVEVPAYQVGRRLRWLGGDIWNLKCAFDSQGRPDIPPRGRAVATFLSDFILRPSALEFVELSDMRPALVEMYHTVMRPFAGRIRKSLRRARDHGER